MLVKVSISCCIGGRGVVCCDRSRRGTGIALWGYRRRKLTMYVNEWWRGCLRVMLPLVPLAVIAVPAYAQVASTDEPGSVLVFPKFAQGLITVDNGSIEPNTQIEIGAVCNVADITDLGQPSPPTCAPKDYEVEVHWVCPGVNIGQETSVCSENDFQV